MKIEKIRVKNFRSFGEDSILIPKPKLNIIIGENNAGKSNIFIALDKLKKVLYSREHYHPRDAREKTVVFYQRDWYCGKSKEEIEIYVSSVLDENEREELISLLSKEISGVKEERLNQLKEEIGRKFEIILKHNYDDKVLPYIKIDCLYLNLFNSASLTPESFYSSTHNQIKWKEIIEEYSDSNTNLFGIINHKFEDKENPMIEFSNRDISDFFIDLFNKKLKIFADIRQRPVGENKEVYESLGGSDAADVLFNLKNSDNPIERDKYRLIQEKFTEFFPNLKLEAVKSQNAYAFQGPKIPLIKILCKDTGYELSIGCVGAGITEIVIFLTNIIASKGNIFVVEEPELHLHPSSQRLFLDFLQNYKEDNQLFVISHSPYFVNTENITDNILLKLVKGKSIIEQIPEDYFDSKDLSKIEKILDSENKEMFFSRAVLLVEGPTEKGAFPVFAKALGNDFDKNNVFTCYVGGKKSFSMYQKILEGFDIPHFVVCDKDAKKDLKVDRAKLTVLDPDFEGILKKYGYDNLLKEAKKEVGKSKPRIGRYVAKKIVNLKEKPEDAIPKEFTEIINKIKV